MVVLVLNLEAVSLNLLLVSEHFVRFLRLQWISDWRTGNACPSPLRPEFDTQHMDLRWSHVHQVRQVCLLRSVTCSSGQTGVFASFTLVSSHTETTVTQTSVPTRVICKTCIASFITVVKWTRLKIDKFTLTITSTIHSFILTGRRWVHWICVAAWTGPQEGRATRIRVHTYGRRYVHMNLSFLNPLHI